MTLNRKWIPTNKYSAGRGGVAVRLIVLHTTEGARTIEDLGAWWNKPSTQASSHVGTDDTHGPNTVGEYVRRENKAWTQSNANPYCVSNELCAFASWSRAEWQKRPNMLAAAAAWIAEEARAFNIPIVRLTPAQAQGGGRGVCQHIDLGAAGGGHVDCGAGFPMDDVLAMAKGSAPAPEPIPPTALPGGAMFVKQKDGSMYWFIANGQASYYRRLPDGLRQNVPDGLIIEDPNGSWLKLWEVRG